MLVLDVAQALQALGYSPRAVWGSPNAASGGSPIALAAVVTTRNG